MLYDDEYVDASRILLNVSSSKPGFVFVDEHLALLSDGPTGAGRLRSLVRDDEDRADVVALLPEANIVFGPPHVQLELSLDDRCYFVDRVAVPLLDETADSNMNDKEFSECRGCCYELA